MKIPDSLKKAISSKVLKKAEEGDSKVSGIKELDSVSKNLSFLPNIAKDLNIARQNIFKLVKLEGGKHREQVMCLRTKQINLLAQSSKTKHQ